MNKKVLVGLLISFIACEAMAVASTSIPPFSPIVNRQKIEAEAVDSPMTQLIKQRKAKKSSVPLVKSVLQRTRTLEDSKKKLTEEVSGLTQKNIDQQIQIGYSKFIAQARQNARDKLVELLGKDTKINNALQEAYGSLQSGDAINMREFLDKSFGEVYDGDLLLPFQLAVLEADRYYQSKLAELQVYITSSELISPAIKREFLSLSESIVNNTTPTKNLESINQYLMDVLQEKFDEYGSVENAFLEVMHRELDGLDDGVLLSDKDESEGREEGSVPEKKVKTNIKTNPQTDDLF